MLHVAEQVAVRLDPARATLDAKGEALMREDGRGVRAPISAAPPTRSTRCRPADWTAERILETLKRVAETHGLKLGDVMQPVRVALTGRPCRSR